MYLKSEKLVHRNQEHEINVFQLFGFGKNWFLDNSRLTNTVAAIWREKKQIPAIWRLQNVVHNCQEQGKRRNQEHEKNVFQLFGFGKKLVPSYLEPDKHCCSYLEGEKSRSLLFGEQKIQFKTVRSIENDYDIYLKSEKLVHSNYEHEKNVLQLFGIGKNWFLAISRLTNTVEAIWREKKVDPCYLATTKCSSQLLGAWKKILTCI